MSLVTIRKDILKEGVPADWARVDDAYGVYVTLRILVPFLACFVAAPYLLPISVWFAVPLCVLMGVYGYKISFILHDCSHNTLFSAEKANLWVGRVCGWMVGVNYDVFRQTHMLHHRYNGEGLDPQHAEVVGFDGAPRSRLLNHLLTPLLGVRAPEVIMGYGGGFLDGQGEEKHIVDKVDKLGRRTMVMWLVGTAGTQLALIAFVTGFGQLLWPVLLYPIAAVTISLFLARIRAFAEHIRPDGGAIVDFTRSHHPNWFDATLLYDAHFNYHVEHHLFPQVPSNRLREIFERFGTRYHDDQTLSPSMVVTVARRVRDAQG